MSDFFATLWIIACQASLSMGFPRQEYWSGLLFPTPGDLPDPGIEPLSPAVCRWILYHWATREAQRELPENVVHTLNIRAIYGERNEERDEDMYRWKENEKRRYWTGRGILFYFESQYITSFYIIVFFPFLCKLLYLILNPFSLWTTFNMKKISE